jgi:hypothetical protein
MAEATLSLDAAITLLKANGYRVTKPREPKMVRPVLNAIGKPYSAPYDPNYRMHYLPSMAHLYKPYGKWMRWVQS